MTPETPRSPRPPLTCYFARWNIPGAKIELEFREPDGRYVGERTVSQDDLRFEHIRHLKPGDVVPECHGFKPRPVYRELFGGDSDGWIERGFDDPRFEPYETDRPAVRTSPLPVLTPEEFKRRLHEVAMADLERIKREKQ